jgi:hypothetical protein
MSPEQARGKGVDTRTDIWAFGCVLYEMLTARPAFSGETTSDTIAAILEREPDWSALPDQTTAGIRRLMKRCLEKDPKHRLRDIGDARIEIEEAIGVLASSQGARAPESASRDRLEARGRRARIARWAAAGVGVLLIGGASIWQLQRAEYFWRNPLDGATLTRLTDFEGAEHHAAISRDGKFVAFLSDRDGTWDAWLSQVGAGESHNLTKGRVLELRNPGTRTPRLFQTVARHLRVAYRSRPAVVSLRAVPAGGPFALPARHLRARLVARRQTHRVSPASGRRSHVRHRARREGRESRASDLRCAARDPLPLSRLVA